MARIDLPAPPFGGAEARGRAATLGRIAALATPLPVALAWWHLFGPIRTWVTPVVMVISVALALGALVTAVTAIRPHARVQAGIATGLLVCQAIIMGCSLVGMNLVDYTLYPSKRVGVAILALVMIAVAGLVLRRFWGRWLALALGAVGMVSGGLNAQAFWSATRLADLQHVEWTNQTFLVGWLFWVSALGGLLIVANLVAPGVAERFASDSKTTTWASQHGLVKSLRALVVSAFAAVPMLLVYAWLQPIVHSTQTTALVLAGALTLGAVLAVRGKVLGALLLVLAGLGLLAQVAVTAHGAAPDQSRVVLYYAVFWLPAAVAALVCGVRIAAPAWRLLTASSASSR